MALGLLLGLLLDETDKSEIPNLQSQIESVQGFAQTALSRL